MLATVSTAACVCVIAALGFRVDVKADQDGEVYCPTPTRLVIKGVDKIRTVACGYNHTACVTVDGRLFMWG